MTSTQKAKGSCLTKQPQLPAQAAHLFSLTTLLISFLHVCICLCGAGNSSRASSIPKEKTALVWGGGGKVRNLDSLLWKLKTCVKNTLNKMRSLWRKCTAYFFCRDFFFFQKTNTIWCRVSLTLSALNLKLHLSELTKALDSLLDSVSIPSGSHHTLPNIPALYSSFQWRQTPMIPGAFSAPSFLIHPLLEHHHSHISWT